MIPREISPDEKVILCFADFESAFQTTLVINTLQGYRFDKDDIWGLQFSYANKQANGVGSQAAKNDGAKDANPNNNNNNSIANQSGSGAGNSAAEASSTSKDGMAKPVSADAYAGAHTSNNSSKK